MCALIRENGGFDVLLNVIHRIFRGKRGGQFGVGLLVTLLDIATANNTVAIVMANPIAKEISEDRNRQPLLQSTPKGHLPIRIGIPVKEKPTQRKEVTIIAVVLPAITTGHRPILPQKRNKPDKFVLDISCRALQIVKPDCFCKILLSNKIEKQ